MMKEPLSRRGPRVRRLLLPALACWLLLWVPCMVLIPSAGCGKAEYEQRMQRRASQLRQSPGAAADEEPADEETDPLDEEP
jgi:hypothetical protein